MAHDAAKNGDLDALIAIGDVSTILNERRENVLHVAARFGQLAIVEYLSNKYPHLLFVTSTANKTVLHHAVESRCLPIVQKIVSLSDRWIDSRDFYDCTPLQRAIKLKFSEAAIFMISAKPESLNQTTCGSKTLLHCAVSSSDDVLVRYLCDMCRQFLYCQDDWGRTPLATAFFVSTSIKIVKLLLEAEPPAIDYPDEDGILPIFNVSNVEIMAYLLNVCPRIIHHKLPKTNANILHTSLLLPDTKITQKLVEFCPTLLQEVSDRGESPLQLAFRSHAINHVKTILQSKPDLVCTDKNGNTVLHMAVHTNDCQVIWNVFDNYRDNLYCENTSGKTPFCLAVENGNRIAVDILKPHITFDMACAMRNTCNQNCNIDLQTFAKEKSATLTNFILPNIADVVFEYLSDVQKTPKKM